MYPDLKNKQTGNESFRVIRQPDWFLKQTQNEKCQVEVHFLGCFNSKYSRHKSTKNFRSEIVEDSTEENEGAKSLPFDISKHERWEVKIMGGRETGSLRVVQADTLELDNVG